MILAGLDETKSQIPKESSFSQGPPTSPKESNFSQDSSTHPKESSFSQDSSAHPKESKASKEITAIKSKSDNCLMVGQTYKNAKVKLQKIKKDKRGFFKGHYKHLYAIYYGSHALLWNTNKDVDDGKYICTFTVQRSALTWGYMFINNCRLKKIEKE